MLLRTVIQIGFLVNNLSPTPLVFSELRILKDFKSFVFGTAHSKGVMGAFFGSAHTKGLRRKWAVISGQWSVKSRTGINTPTG
jgi:hypothetical protein